MDQQLREHLERRGRLNELYQHDDEPLMPNAPKATEADFTDDEGPLSAADFADYDQAVHASFVDKMDEAVAKLRGVGFLVYKGKMKDLWHLVSVVRYIGFCEDTWEKNIKGNQKHEPRALNRWEMEAAWYRMLMKAYEAWDPRSISKRKVKKRALEFKKKVLQKGLKQIYTTEANDFWADKKRKYPNITDTNHCEWPNESSFDAFHEVYGSVLCSPPINLPEIQDHEIEGNGDGMDIDNKGDVGQEDDDDIEMNRARLEKMDLDD
ncbi:hypothetical protein HYFRA_00002456 [Hymenoscyphus fraxineus]|uniref:Uncharacterized protein n=1 Tax=Hymenoscyphus fraxineus TaxID=746836 RepID=A0A9N9LAB4_9HELO|nr:hypothetical protein HYFRA_00002456 [Hymenoscyphus fraxineus]